MINHYKLLTKYCPVLLLILIIINSPYKLIMVRGISMSPTFHNNQLLIAKSIDNYQKIKVNDIVICELEDNTIVKRVKYIENQNVYYYFDSNDYQIKIIDEHTYHYLSTHPIARNKTLIQKIIIPKNSIYLIGDNLNNSDDSRRFGPIPFNNIKYKVIHL
jgi:signal peptidase I